MEDQNALRSVMLAWLGAMTTWASLELAQVIVGLIAGLLTVIYTSLKIWDWVVIRCDRSRYSSKRRS